MSSESKSPDKLISKQIPRFLSLLKRKLTNSVSSTNQEHEKKQVKEEGRTNNAKDIANLTASQSEKVVVRKRRRGSTNDVQEESHHDSTEKGSKVTSKVHKGFIIPRKRRSSFESPKWKNVLFFGDSITWGMAHDYTGRYEVPWPRLLQDKLKLYRLNIVESALCSRTTCWDDPNNSDWMTGAESHFFNGLSHFVPEFISATPSWLVLLLGTNDLKTNMRREAKCRNKADASTIAKNFSKIIAKAREIQSTSPFCKGELNILVIPPPVVRHNQLMMELGYDQTSVTISKDFANAYQKVCLENNVDCVHVEIDMTSSIDGIHITEEANSKIAQAVWTAMREKLGPVPIHNFSPKTRARILVGRALMRYENKVDSDSGSSHTGDESIRKAIPKRPQSPQSSSSTAVEGEVKLKKKRARSGSETGENYGSDGRDSTRTLQYDDSGASTAGEGDRSQKPEAEFTLSVPDTENNLSEEKIPVQDNKSVVSAKIQSGGKEGCSDMKEANAPYETLKQVAAVDPEGRVETKVNKPNLVESTTSKAVSSASKESKTVVPESKTSNKRPKLLLKPKHSVESTKKVVSRAPSSGRQRMRAEKIAVSFTSFVKAASPDMYSSFISKLITLPGKSPMQTEAIILELEKTLGKNEKLLKDFRKIMQGDNFVENK